MSAFKRHPWFFIAVMAALLIISIIEACMEGDSKRKMVWTALVGLAIIAGIVIGIRAAPAHDHNRPDLTPWFETLKSGKGYCCDGSDALAIDDPDWDSANGHYRVKLEGEWVDVPDDAVITEPNHDGRALVWPYRKDGKLNQVRCFMPGAGS